MVQLRGQLVPLKSMVPKSMGREASRWREFQIDVEEWLEAQFPGVRAVLKSVSRAAGGTTFDSTFMEPLRAPVAAAGGDLNFLLSGRNAMYTAFRTILEGMPRTSGKARTLEMYLKAGIGCASTFNLM